MKLRVDVISSCRFPANKTVGARDARARPHIGASQKSQTFLLFWKFAPVRDEDAAWRNALVTGTLRIGRRVVPP